MQVSGLLIPQEFALLVPMSTAVVLRLVNMVPLPGSLVLRA